MPPPDSWGIDWDSPGSATLHAALEEVSAGLRKVRSRGVLVHTKHPGRFSQYAVAKSNHVVSHQLGDDGVGKIGLQNASMKQTKPLNGLSFGGAAWGGKQLR